MMKIVEPGNTVNPGDKWMECNRMDKVASRAVGILLTTILLTPAILHGGEPARDPLFHIERNKNANIVQYDAQLGPDGLLLSKEPVVVYWVRLAHEGEIKELTWVQQKFAYGFTAKLDKKTNTATLDMAADLGRTFKVVRDDDDYRAVADIDGVESYVEKLFIQASGKGTSTKVEYIELFGKAMNGQGEQYERFAP